MNFLLGNSVDCYCELRAVAPIPKNACKQLSCACVFSSVNLKDELASIEAKKVLGTSNAKNVSPSQCFGNHLTCNALKSSVEMVVVKN